MRSAALSAACAAGALLLAATAAGAHLQPSGTTSLLGMIAAADGILVARSVQPTHARSATEAATAFVAREAIAGEVPSGPFVLEQRAPLLRYDELSDALVLVAREPQPAGGVRWVSVQPAGAAILLDPIELSDETRAVLRDLWRAAHPEGGGAPDESAAVDALVRALAQPQRKLRALAYLDLARLANDPAHFPAAAVERLRRYGDVPGDDPELAQAVRALGEKLGRRTLAEGEPAASATAVQ